MGVATGPWLLSERLSAIFMQKTIFGAVINLILNFALVPRWHGLGAAIATVIAYFSATFLWHLVDPRTRKIGKLQTIGLFYRLRGE